MNQIFLCMAFNGADNVLNETKKCIDECNNHLIILKDMLVLYNDNDNVITFVNNEIKETRIKIGFYNFIIKNVEAVKNERTIIC